MRHLLLVPLFLLHRPLWLRALLLPRALFLPQALLPLLLSQVLRPVRLKRRRRQLHDRLHLQQRLLAPLVPALHRMEPRLTLQVHRVLPRTWAQLLARALVWSLLLPLAMALHKTSPRVVLVATAAENWTTDNTTVVPFVEFAALTPP